MVRAAAIAPWLILTFPSRPVGIGLFEDPESTWSLLALMHAYGVNRHATVEAANFLAVQWATSA